MTPFRTGLLLAPNEFGPRLSDSVDHLLGQRDRYSQAARRSVLGRTWPVVCGRLVEHYNDLVSGRHHAPVETRSA